MGPLQVVFSGVVTLFFYAMILTGVYKLFRIHSELSEMKKMVTELKIQSDSLTVISAAQSSENLMRAVHSDPYADTPRS